MKRPKREIWHPAEYDIADVRAIQALALYAMGAERPWPPGEEPRVPSPHEVKLALDCIMHKLAMTYENPAMAAFAAKDPNVSWFMSGRASVGQALAKLTVLKVSTIEGK